MAGSTVLQVGFKLVMTVACAAFFPLAVLAAAGLADPRFASAAFGVAMLAVGADGIAGALVAEWPRGWWEPPANDRPAVWIGRLSSLGSGLLIASAGVLLIGLDQVPLTARLVGSVVFLVGFALLLVGGYYDRRQAGEAAPTSVVTDRGDQS